MIKLQLNEGSNQDMNTYVQGNKGEKPVESMKPLEYKLEPFLQPLFSNSKDTLSKKNV